MRKIIFATKNENKMKEIREIYSDLDVQLCSLREENIEAEIVEDGTTFEENALIKARTIRDLTGETVLADDSGLVVDALDGAHGVYSARWMGEETDYHTKNGEIVRRLEGVEGADRSARFVCAVAAAFPDGTDRVVTAAMEGLIGYEEKGQNGFGYDPIFFLPEYGMTSAELSMEEKDKISHRGKALRLMKPYL